MELWVNEFWLFITAVIFTAIGYYWGVKAGGIGVIDLTIDSLIKQGYIKTRGSGKDMVMLKYDESDND